LAVLRWTIPTVGVEEEYFLLDCVTGRPVPAADRILARVRRLENRGDALGCCVQSELLLAQVEIATAVCHDVDDVSASLHAVRRTLQTAAWQQRILLAPLGTSPLDPTNGVQVTAAPRYQQLYPMPRDW